MTRLERHLTRWRGQSGFGYPGGPKIDKVSKEGNPEAIAFPRAHVEDAPYDFRQRVKSAVLNYINGCKMKGAGTARLILRLPSRKQSRRAGGKCHACSGRISG